MTAALVLALTLPARATLPLPLYPECGEPNRPDLCPGDLGVDWQMISWIPPVSADSIRASERALGSGVWADRAFRTSTGRFDVIVAVGDTGVDWGTRDLRRKYYLHAPELPVPQDASGADAASHDANGDGLFNIDDYEGDPRVALDAGDAPFHDVLDVSDLLATFSDGVDDDGNGYVDDISGWDFFERDNDAWHSLFTDYGEHGGGVAKDMAAEGDNGGDVGMCPNCALLPVRVGDAFIIDGTRVAEAIAYATQMDAASISLAVGGMSRPTLAADAVRYAFDNGMTVVSVGGDENSYHHNQPAMLPTVVYVKSVRHASTGSDVPVNTYMSQQNCNNFGARMVLAASSRACATGASGKTAGAVGLLHSAARDAGLELHAGEVYQLLIGTADDIWLTPDEQEEARSYPSSEGWDPYFGYGRLNVAHAVEAVAAGEIPPWLTIEGPDWFAPLDPRQTPSVSVEGVVSAERAGGFTWSAEVGTGAEPTDWAPLGSGSGSGTEAVSFGELDLTALAWAPTLEPDRMEGVIARYERMAERQVTVRVRVEDDAGRAATLRRTFFVEQDPDALPGFPIHIGESAEASPQLGDLDGDGVYEILFGTADGVVHALYGDGTAVAGWPVQIPALADSPSTMPAVADGTLPASPDPVLNAVAVGDLDGDGEVEVVAASHYGSLYAWHADGTLVAGFPHQTIGRDRLEWGGDLWNFDQGYMGAPALWDLDGDGALEIIAAAMDGRLYVVDHTGADWGPYPIELCHPLNCGVDGYRAIASPTVGDVDGDGDPDIGVGTNESVDGRYSVSHLVDARTGITLPGWPRLDMGLIGQATLLPLVGEGHPSAMAFADIDGDGDLEIANPIMLGTSDVLHHDGEVALDLDYFFHGFGEDNNVDDGNMASIIQFVTNPAWGDLDGDGTPDLLLGGASAQYAAGMFVSKYIEYQHPISAWSGKPNADGMAPMLPGFPQQVEDMQILLSPSVADLDGDGAAEVVYGSGGWVLHAWDATGAAPAGWPKFTGGWMLGSPAIGDVDGDGYLDVLVTTREGWLFAWSTAGPADVAPQWAAARHDAWNTGNATVPIAAQAGPPDAGGDTGGPATGGGGKGCCKEDDADRGAAALLALPLGLLAALRRRRRYRSSGAATSASSPEPSSASPS